MGTRGDRRVRRLPNETVALTAWARRDEFSVDDMTEHRVKGFIQTFVCRFNPQDFDCDYLGS